MDKSKRIVVTGLGIISAAGPLESTWDAIQQGKTYLKPSAQFEFDGLSNHALSYVTGEISDFKPIEFVPDRKLHKLLSRHDFIGMRATNDAIAHSGMIPYRDQLADPSEFNDKTGIFAASPGNAFSQQYDYMPVIASSQGCPQQFGLDFPIQVHPMWLLRILPNNVLGHIGISYGFRGTNYNLVNHSVAGLQTVIEAMYHLQIGDIDRAIITGYECASEAHTVRYLDNLGVLGKQEINSFDLNRTGTLAGEGSGAIVIETLDSAQQRHAKIYGELVDGACFSETTGSFMVRDDGEGIKNCISKMLKNNNIAPEEVGMITAHANGTKASDASEAFALGELFKHQPPVTGFKWCFGHCFTAAGIMDTALALRCLDENIVPPIATLRDLAPECEGINVSPTHQTPTAPFSVIISRGFGSFSAALLMKKYEDQIVRCGIDIIELSRFKEFLGRSSVAQLQSIFSGPELEDIDLDNLCDRDIQHLAGWFCLKEACLKIFPPETSLKSLDFGDIIIDHDEFGAPVIVVTDKIKKIMEKYHLKALSVSLSHSDNYSCGLVIGA